MRAVARIAFSCAGVLVFFQNPRGAAATGEQEAMRVQNSVLLLALGQNETRNLNPSAIQGGQIATGTEIHAVLDTPLSTRTARQGDRFTATVAQTVWGNDGLEAIPAGARLDGEVAEAEEGRGVTTTHSRGKLSLRFHGIALPGEQNVPLSATLISVHNTNGKETRSTGGETLSGARSRDVVKNTGTETGTLPELVFGNPLHGLAVGAFNGGGYVLSVKGREVDLPAQTGMVIRLDQPFGIQSLGSQ